MDRILVNYEPFTLKQEIIVYQNGAVSKITSATIDEVPSVIKGLCSEYGIEHIDLCGNDAYLSKFKTQMNTEFDCEPKEIDIIKR